MNLIPLIVDSMLLFGIICVSVYGAAILPAGAQVPVHFGPAGFNHWVPRNTGLLMWPAGGVVIYAVLVIITRNQGTTGGSPPAALTIVLAVMLVTQVGALRVALNRSGRSGRSLGTRGWPGEEHQERADDHEWLVVPKLRASVKGLTAS